MQGYLSEKELGKYQKLLLEEREKIKKEIEKLKSEDPFLDTDRLTDNKPEEDALEEVGHETVEAQIKSLEESLDEIEKALKKIKRGTYGKCEICGGQIERERLDLIPYARFCSSCKRKIE